MKTLLTAILLAVLPLTSYSQAIKYNKEIQPLIDSKTYTVESKNLAILYHGQNTNADGTLTDKAVLMSYDNVYSTRVFLGLCYYSLGVANDNPAPLDSSLYYFNLAQGMAGVDDVSTYISGVAKKQKELVILQKNKTLKAEEEARKEKYSLKTSTVTFKSAEFIGHCRVECTDSEGNSMILYNPELGKYASHSTNCGIADELSTESFIITHQLQMTSVYSEDAGSSEFENPVLKSIVLLDKEKEFQFNLKFVQAYKSAMAPMVDEALSIGAILPDEKLRYDTLLDTLTVVNLGADILKTSLEGKIRAHQQKNQAQDNLDAQMTAQANDFGIEQKKIKGSVSCPTCPKKVLHSFLVGLQNSDMPSAKKQMSECCYSSSSSGCDGYAQYCRVMGFSKLSASPSSGISKANKWLAAEDKWFVYFESPTVAKVIITPPSGQYYAMSYFMLILENGQWKVYGAEDNERRFFIAKYAQGNQ